MAPPPKGGFLCAPTGAVRSKSQMPVTLVVGGQWGDEGKAKIIDYLARDVDFVVRYQGGANAGHTVVVGAEKFAFQQVPSGHLVPEGDVCVGGRDGHRPTRPGGRDRRHRRARRRRHRPHPRERAGTPRAAVPRASGLRVRRPPRRGRHRYHAQGHLTRVRRQGAPRGHPWRASCAVPRPSQAGRSSCAGEQQDSQTLAR